MNPGARLPQGGTDSHAVLKILSAFTNVTAHEVACIGYLSRDTTHLVLGSLVKSGLVEFDTDHNDVKRYRRSAKRSRQVVPRPTNAYVEKVREFWRT
jgi:hypothetical protein